MRLIDANKLRCEWLHGATKGETFTPLEIVDSIDKQPTVEFRRVKHAHWILEREPDGTPYCFHCSNCDADFSVIKNKEKTQYCPDCGARMDEEFYEDAGND